MKSKEEYWERQLKSYERSGLSQEDFCSEQGIPIAKLYPFGEMHLASK